MSGDFLPEIPETDATGPVAETYADVRHVVGLPFVATVYRVLATQGGLVERLWAEVRPNLLQPAARDAAAGLAAAEPLPVEPLPATALAVTSLDAGLARATLDAYRRANSHNLVAFAALFDGAPGRGEPAEPLPEPGEPPPILPIAALAGLDAPTLQLLEEMSDPVSGGERPLLVPGLLRHFAHDPALLALLWAALRPALRDGELDARAAVLWARARTAATELPFAVGRLDDEWARGTVERFSGVIPRMLVLGGMLEQALAEAR